LLFREAKALSPMKVIDVVIANTGVGAGDTLAVDGIDSTSKCRTG
jgi:hypothetical protein